MKSARMDIPKSEYDERIKKLQKTMEEEGIDILVAHACECESATVRYLTNFWAVFDFVGVLIPRSGAPILLTGGPESYDFAVQFAQIDDIRIHPLYVETSAPQWDKPTKSYNYTQLFEELKMPIKKIGIANVNTIPYVIMEDIKKGAPHAEFVEAEKIIMKQRSIKSDIEIDVLREAAKITQESVIKTVDFIEVGVREWEVEAEWKANIYKMGAEGTGYPCWVTSGDSTYQSLCKSTDRIIQNNSMVQLSLGAKYNGYCGNMGRAIVLGKIPQRHMDMINVAFDCLNETLDIMKNQVAFAEIYNVFQARLKKNGFEGLNLYGPAHGTGLQECEGPWVDNRTDMILLPNMVFNIDIWIADEKYGVRLEDCVLVTESGLEQLTTWNRNIIYK